MWAVGQRCGKYVGTVCAGSLEELCADLRKTEPLREEPSGGLFRASTRDWYGETCRSSGVVSSAVRNCVGRARNHTDGRGSL